VENRRGPAANRREGGRRSTGRRRIDAGQSLLDGISGGTSGSKRLTAAVTEGLGAGAGGGGQAGDGVGPMAGGG
jgi:hypothetical protein